MIGMVNLTVEKIISLCHGELICGSEDVIVNSVITDSRENGDESLFVPIVGEKFNGHNFIESLLKSKAVSAVLTMEDVSDDLLSINIPIIKCENTLYALGRIGQYCREVYSGRVYGVTGTNGKTTTKELMHRLLSEKYITHKSEKNYNNEIGVPFALMALKFEHEAAVLEMGMNHIGEISRLSAMVKPNIGIITNIGAGHLEFLGSVENVANAKLEILHGMNDGSTLIVNRDTSCFDMIETETERRNINLLTVGLHSNADIYPDSYELTEDSVKIIYKGNEIVVPMYGKHNVYNILLAIAVAEQENIEIPALQRALLDFAGVSGRSEIIDNKFKVINDTYNSNPLSSEMALVSVAEIFTDRKKIAVLSDMKELGEAAGKYHREIGAQVNACSFDFLCLYGDMCDSYKSGAMESGFPEEKIMVFSNKDDLSSFLLEFLKGDEIVLVKGSRSMKMEEVVNRITEGVS